MYSQAFRGFSYSFCAGAILQVEYGTLGRRRPSTSIAMVMDFMWGLACAATELPIDNRYVLKSVLVGVKTYALATQSIILHMEYGCSVGGLRTIKSLPTRLPFITFPHFAAGAAGD